MDLDFFSDFERVRDLRLKKGQEYATAKALSWQLQKLEGHILAQKQQFFISKGMPVGRAEVEAKASPEYSNHIRGTSAAIEKELRLKAEYENLDSNFEQLRSLCSLEKKNRD